MTDKATSITVSTKLIAAVAKWAIADSSRPHLTMVVFQNDEMVAVDGHRLVRVPMATNGLKFGIDRRDVFAIAAAQREINGSAYAELRISIDGEHAIVRLDADGHTTMRVRARDAADCPPVDKVMPTEQETPAPGEYTFDPLFLAEIEEVVRASGAASRGVKCKAWSVIRDGGYSGPMLFESAAGIRFVIMPMRF